jgi:AraC-like DNA-binding protein
MADSRETPLVEIGSPPNVEFRLEPHTVSIGSGRSADSFPSTIMLSGLYPLDRTRCHPVVSDLPEVIHLPAHRGQHPSLRAAIDLLSVELEHPSIGADAVVSALLDTLWLYALRAWYQEHGKGDGWGPALHDPAISAALCRIHANPERQWTVEDLGAAAGLSRAAFARRFTSLVGQPPLGYLTWLRMSTAAQLLRDSDNPLGAVAKKVGYTSEFAFANAFKRTYGTAPGTYRRRLSKATFVDGLSAQRRDPARPGHAPDA